MVRTAILTGVDATDLGHILWEDKRGDVPIRYTGAPFVIVGKEERECHHGKQRKKSTRKTQEQGDHNYISRKGRNLIQVSKKLDCRAKIKMRMIVRFPEYTMNEEHPFSQRRKLSSDLKSNFSERTIQEFQVFLREIGEHENHVTGELAGYGLPLHVSVKEKIRDLVTEDGLRNPSEIKRHVDLFSKSQHPEMSLSNRRYFPSAQDVRNHLFLTLKQNRYSSDDQTNLQTMIETWQLNSPEDKFYFRPASSENDENIKTLLFVHQTEFQKRLLQKYGRDIIVMDSTYKTMKYDLPLFFVCVLTNVGYSVVCTFILGKETKHQIKEALGIIKLWNSPWQPMSCMCDMDQREIGAIEEIFEGTVVYLCDWHREQSWKRWFHKNRIGKETEKEITSKLRSIGRSQTEEEFEANIQELKSHQLYESNVRFKGWIDRYWLENKQRWVQCFRQNMITIKVNTTNGVETQNKQFKYNYLKRCGASRTLTATVTILTQEFVPDAQKRYISKNVQSSTSFKKYASDVPNFLHGRPKPFIKHCMARLSNEDIYLTPEDDGFVATNQNNVRHYINTDSPSCTCPDWKKYYWPCKHMLKVLLEFPAFGWDFLPCSYKELPLFNLDIMENVSPSDIEIGVNDSPFNIDHQADEVTTNNEIDIRNELLEMTKEIQNDIYNLPLIVLKEIKIDLKSAMSKVEKFQPSGLRLLKKRRERRGHYKKQISSTPHAQATDEIDLVLRDIWESEPSALSVVEVGPYLLHNSSFHSLKTELVDEVMDAYLLILARSANRNVLHIPTIICTSVFNGERQLHDLMRQESVLDYEVCIGAKNDGGCHWTLIIILPRTSSIMYINPLGEMDEQEQIIVQHWYNFLKARFDSHIDSQPIGTWNLETPSHARQSDGNSCGVYVLQLADLFLNGKDLNFVWNDTELLQARWRIGRRLLAEGENPEIQSERTVNIDLAEGESTQPVVNDETKNRYNTRQPKPVKRKRSSFIYGKLKKNSKKKLFCVCQQEDDGRLYWECSRCKDWYHPGCIGLTEEDEPDVYICLKCQASISSDEDEEPNESHYLFSKEQTEKYMHNGISRIREIISFENREAEWMLRHKLFSQGARAAAKGFGESWFSPQALHHVELCLMKTFFRDNTDRIYTWHGRIEGMQDPDMLRLFAEDRFIAKVYLKEIMMREALSAMFSSALNVDFNRANHMLRDCEDRSLLQAVKNASEKCEQNRKKWIDKLHL